MVVIREVTIALMVTGGGGFIAYDCEYLTFSWARVLG